MALSIVGEVARKAVAPLALVEMINILHAAGRQRDFADAAAVAVRGEEAPVVRERETHEDALPVVVVLARILFVFLLFRAKLRGLPGF